ncbi:MAG: chorismate synthase [Bacteroidales bacterium]
MNSFGRKFKLSIFGESHGKSVGISIDGCPPGIELDESHFLKDLDRRRSGAKGTTPRLESDLPEIISGVFNGYTTGAPLTVVFKNEDTRSKDYSKLKEHPRPGHADFTAFKKYSGFNDYRGGGHFSARLTLGLVCAGVIAKKIVRPVDIEAKLISVHGSQNIELEIDNAIKNGESVGGIVQCVAKNLPVGLGEPFFDSVESVISHLAFSIPAIKGIEFGSGFDAAKMYGSQHNDLIINESGKTETNNAAGVNGGITNGNDLVFRIAVKPTSSIPKAQETYNLKTHKVEQLLIGGRHDVCVALRVPVVLEAVTAVALADFILLEGKEVFH